MREGKFEQVLKQIPKEKVQNEGKREDQGTVVSTVDKKVILGKC